MLYGFDRPTAPILVMLPPAGMSLPLVSRLALALSANFRPDMLGVARSSRLLHYCPVLLFAVIGDHMMPTIYPKALGATAPTQMRFSINPNLVVVDRNQASLIQLLEKQGLDVILAALQNVGR
jgi:hypothetical protein